MSGNCGRAEGLWGTLRLGTLGTKVGSCTELPNRNLAWVLFNLGVFPVGGWKGRAFGSTASFSLLG